MFRMREGNLKQILKCCLGQRKRELNGKSNGFLRSVKCWSETNMAKDPHSGSSRFLPYF